MAATLDTAKEAERVLSIVANSAEAQRRYNQELHDLLVFGTSTPYIYKKAPLWRRIWWRVQGYVERVRDAWLVLTGRAHIADD